MAIFAQADQMLRDQILASQILNAGMLIATLILAGLTGWYAWSTHRYVCLTRELVQSQTDPFVIAYIHTAEYNIAEIVIKNFGQGIARDIRLARSEEDQNNVWDQFSQGSACSSEFFELLKDGIRVLPPGEKVAVQWNRKDAISLPCFNGLRRLLLGLSASMRSRALISLGSRFFSMR